MTDDLLDVVGGAAARGRRGARESAAATALMLAVACGGGASIGPGTVVTAAVVDNGSVVANLRFDDQVDCVVLAETTELRFQGVAATSVLRGGSVYNPAANPFGVWCDSPQASWPVDAVASAPATAVR